MIGRPPRVANAVSTWFGCGYSPSAPGTVGSAAAIGTAILIEHFAGWRPLWFGTLAVIVTMPAMWAAGETARQAKIKDPQFVVVDEVVGQWLALAGARALNWKAWIAAFALFRLFDIWKPFPVRQLESLPGGVGIVADDLMAGLYAALVLFLAGWFNLY
ncbi:MAG TPA: phosphatidylglycerophosphatase A [Bryobacteraceae bacterium]|jgi:phosphatidylglycerophosphatase A|nr:phosphatidylglycerophosphatase A [Bryobacteraceae bacterium]